MGLSMEANPPLSGDQQRWTRSVTMWTLVALAVGVAWRTVRYLLQFPVWGDEAFICLNFPEQTFMGLTEQLRHKQVAPLLFLWSELATFKLLGGSELAVRLMPFLAGVASLFLFWQICRASLPPLATALACAFLAVSYFPVRHSCEAKPYAFDLFMPLILMAPAFMWLRRPEQTRWLTVLAILTPLAIFGSYPAVFVGGSLSLALLPAVWSRPDARVRLLYVAYNVLLAAAFLGHYFWVGRAQVGPPQSEVSDFYQKYWQDAFPPHAPLPLAWWLVKAHAGDMLGYPIGGGNFGSTLTLLLCLAGAWAVWQTRNGPLLLMCLLPFVLSCAAAFLHCYPYGTTPRLSQHLAPAICMLAGCGLAAIVGRLRSQGGMQARAVSATFLILVAVGLVGLVRDLRQPFKTKGEIAARTFVQQMFAQAGPEDQIVVLEPAEGVKSVLLWYLKQNEQRVTWGGRLHDDLLERRTQSVWCVHFGWSAARPEPVESRLAQSRRPWHLTRHDHQLVPGDRPTSPVEYWEIHRWSATSE